MKKILMTAAVMAITAIAPATAQEVCITEAENSVSEWSRNNSSTLNELWATYDAAANPAAVIVTYRGQSVPLLYAIEQETALFKAGLTAIQDAAIGRAEDCAGDLRVAIPRQAWDIFRATTFPGIPEEKLRIDFAEWQRGNFAGGKKSIVREVGRALDPSSWF